MATKISRLRFRRRRRAVYPLQRTWHDITTMTTAVSDNNNNVINTKNNDNTTNNNNSATPPITTTIITITTSKTVGTTTTTTLMVKIATNMQRKLKSVHSCEADLWKMMKNPTAGVWLVWIEFPSIFSLLKMNERALFKKFMLFTLFNNINEWPQWVIKAGLWTNLGRDFWRDLTYKGQRYDSRVVKTDLDYMYLFFFCFLFFFLLRGGGCISCKRLLISFRLCLQKSNSLHTNFYRGEFFIIIFLFFIREVLPFSCAWFTAKHVAPDHASVQGPWFDFEPRTWCMNNVQQNPLGQQTTLREAHTWFTAEPRTAKPLYCQRPSVN